MILGVYSIYDKKAACYRFPMFVSSDGQAVRSFLEACRDKSTELGKYPEDFALYKSGTFNDNIGIVGDATLIHLCNGTEALTKKEEE